MQGPKQNVGPIGSAVMTFIGYKQTDRQAKYIYRLKIILHNIISRYIHTLVRQWNRKF